MQKLFPLLLVEIQELNGHPENGLTLEQYRAQEIADIHIFAWDVVKYLGRKNDLREESLKTEAKTIIADIGTRKNIGEYEDQFLEVKRRMVQIAENLSQQIVGQEKSGRQGQNVEIFIQLRGLLAHTLALFYYVHEDNPAECIQTKDARNELKHKAIKYEEKIPYETGRAEARKEWGRKIEVRADHPLRQLLPNIPEGEFVQAEAEFWRTGPYQNLEYSQEEVKGWGKPIQHRWYEKAALNIITYLAKRSLR